MPSRYHVIDEHGPSGDVITTNPYWVITVFRFLHPLTYSRALGGSFTGLYQEAVRIRGKPLIISNMACTALTISQNKNSHLLTMAARLLPDPALNWVAEITPGDWVMAWIVNSEEKARSVIDRIDRGEPCNGFDDGLKFVGRAGSPRKKTSQDPNTGMRTSYYQLNAAGFQEFDASLFYEEHLQERIPAIGQYWARLGGVLNKFVAEHGLGISVHKVMPFLLDLFLGRGVNRNLGLPDIDGLRNTTGLEAAHSYILPDIVPQLLGKTQTSKAGGLFTAADVLEMVYGVQQYSDYGDVSPLALSEETTDNPLGLLFNPDRTQYAGSRRYTQIPMMGTFLPTPPQFKGKTVWSILNQYLNPAVNEMYTCLRVNPRGEVVPTLVVRQLPFSTEMATATVPLTKHLSLPRWVIHPALMTGEDLGRADALRINFVHVYGDMGPVKNNMYNGQVVRWPPRRDDLDIARSGLKNYSMTVACHERDVRLGGPEKWMDVLSDILMGQHLTLNGTLEMIGIQAPICVGDNLEYEENVYHIEAINHSCGIDPMGKKQFRTTVQISHGMLAAPQPGLLGLYSGMTADALRSRSRASAATATISMGKKPHRIPGPIPISSPGFRTSLIPVSRP
jgi:hypothetical protein